MGHAERLAEGLHARYRNKSMAACRRVVAALLGHEDWSGLQAAVAGGGVPDRPDDEVAADVALRVADISSRSRSGGWVDSTTTRNAMPRVSTANG